MQVRRAFQRRMASTLADGAIALGALNVSGALAVTGAVTAGSTLGVTGAVTAASTVDVTGALTTLGRATAAGFSSSIDGTSGARAFNFSSDPDTGLHRGAANRLIAGGGGNTGLQLDSTTVATAYAFQHNAALRVSAGPFSMENVLTPASIGAGPTADIAWQLSTYNCVRQQCTANAVVSGTVAPTVAVVAVLINITTVAAGFTLTLNHEDAGSTAANRFSCPNGANVVLSPQAAVMLRYDLTAARWFVLGRA